MATTTLEIDRGVVQALEAKARAQGLSLEAYLWKVALGGVQEPGSEAETAPEVEGWLDDLARGMPAAPSLDPGFSRRDIYGEHD